ncbi:MAG TPA: divalent-cation tolerance protein CutA [Pyrinomonadaceae bacterium]|jgi:periplasmic divalent cation tolerance protein|nr:divalent-cation tolerance protein CutA [Pyrinomonadaceae bacterium]
MDEPIMVLLTAANRAEASRLAEMLVGSRLAACVQILPRVESIYYWSGAVQRDEEILLFAKSVRGNFARLEQEIRALHSYETPEIIAFPLAECSAPYLQWLRDMTAQTKRDQ